MFDNLKEIWNELSDRIKNVEIRLIENINNLIISVPLPTSKIKEITFQLNEDKKTEQDEINNLNRIILELKNENTQLKKEKKEIKFEHKKK